MTHPVSRDEVDNIWVAVNKLRDKDQEHEKHIFELQMESNACKTAREALNSDVVQMCEVLKETKVEVIEKINDKHSQTQTQIAQIVNDQKDFLKDLKVATEEINKSRGRAQALGIIVILINCAIGLGTIIGMLWAASKVLAKISGVNP
jgi:chromosome segregation ATPase